MYHRLFDIDPTHQSQGIAKDLLANSVKLYDQAGVCRVGVFAALDVGGYAWAKYGFQPKNRAETRQLFGQISDRLDSLKGVPPAARAVVQSLLESEDPKAVWAISDLDGIMVKRKGRRLPLGKALMLGTHWKGSLHLDDPQARQRFDQYVHKTDNSQAPRPKRR